MTTQVNGLLPCRSPPRLRRSRWVIPEDAGGDVPRLERGDGQNAGGDTPQQGAASARQGARVLRREPADESSCAEVVDDESPRPAQSGRAACALPPRLEGQSRRNSGEDPAQDPRVEAVTHVGEGEQSGGTARRHQEGQAQDVVRHRVDGEQSTPRAAVCGAHAWRLALHVRRGRARRGLADCVQVAKAASRTPTERRGWRDGRPVRCRPARARSSAPSRPSSSSFPCPFARPAPGVRAGPASAHRSTLSNGDAARARRALVARGRLGPEPGLDEAAGRLLAAVDVQVKTGASIRLEPPA